MQLTKSALATVTVIALFLSACGGSDDNGSKGGAGAGAGGQAGQDSVGGANSGGGTSKAGAGGGSAATGQCADGTKFADIPGCKAYLDCIAKFCASLGAGADCSSIYDETSFCDSGVSNDQLGQACTAALNALSSTYCPK